MPTQIKGEEHQAVWAREMERSASRTVERLLGRDPLASAGLPEDRDSKKRFPFSPSGALLSLIALAVLSWSIASWTRAYVQARRSDVESNLGERALAVVGDFLKAEGWEAKSQFVRDRERVQPKMREFYEERGYPVPVPGGELIHGAPVPTNHGVEVEVEVKDGPLRLRSFRVLIAEGHGLVDWEAHARE